MDLWTVVALGGATLTALWSRRLLRDSDHPTTRVLLAITPTAVATALGTALAIVVVFLVTQAMVPWLHWGWMVDASTPTGAVSSGSVPPWRAIAVALGASPALVWWLPAALHRRMAGQARDIGRDPARWALYQGLGPALAIILLGLPVGLALLGAYHGPLTTMMVWRRLDPPGPLSPPDHGPAAPDGAPQQQASPVVLTGAESRAVLAATVARCLLLWWMVVLAVAITVVAAA